MAFDALCRSKPIPMPMTPPSTNIRVAPRSLTSGACARFLGENIALAVHAPAVTRVESFDLFRYQLAFHPAYTPCPGNASGTASQTAVVYLSVEFASNSRAWRRSHGGHDGRLSSMPKMMFEPGSGSEQ